MGIWQDVELQAWDKGKIVEVQIVQQNLSEHKAELVSNIEIESVQEGTFDVLVFVDSKKILKQKSKFNAGFKPERNPFSNSKP